MMETNNAICAGACEQALPDLWLTVDWSPLLSFSMLVTAAVAVSVLWLSAINLRALLLRRSTQADFHSIDGRLAISKYILVFFATLTFWQLMVCQAFVVSSLAELTQAGHELGQAQLAVIIFNAQAPRVWALILVVLSGIHALVGILCETKRRRHLQGREPRATEEATR